MVIKLDVVVVIDIEATCWAGATPVGQEHEIIEIGICTLDIKTGERIDRESLLVKPTKSKVSQFCTELTGLTQQDVDNGLRFDRACSILRKKFKTKSRIWASYGDYDRKMFEKQCAAHGVAYPFNGTHINIKSLYAMLMGLEREISLSAVLSQLNIEFEGQPHRGIDDAWNEALILSHLIEKMRLPLAE
ncbi:MAG: DNA polymerase III [Phototrophicales bacterium]|nr:MAG: DNA polymerase III [Phototrophicales bacterium]